MRYGRGLWGEMGRIYGHILLYTCMKISKTKKKCEVEIKTPKTCIGEKAAVLGKIDRYLQVGEGK